MALVNNFVLTKFLGLCPFFGVSRKLSSALSMGMAVIVVMFAASVVSWILFYQLLVPFGITYMRTVIFILVIASLVQILEITIRRTNEIIKSTFSIKICSRDEEIKQIRNIIISERPGTYIFRTDIKSFFDRLPFLEIIERLFSQNLVMKNTYNHLLNIFKETSTKGTKGLPRGLCISSSLSEYALHDFDHEILSSEYCLYYARYVDDIALLTSSEIDNIEVSDIEVRGEETSYTYDTLLKLRKIYRGAEFYEIIGEDSADYLHEWKDYEKMVEEVKFIVLKRRGFDYTPAHSNIEVLESPIFPYSSTEVREAIAEGKDTSNMICEKVAEIIKRYKLYETREV